MRALALLLALVGPAHAETLRTSRLAMGTVVGITVVAEPEAGNPAMEAAWAAIEAGEAALSEWRPGSKTSRLAAGEEVSLEPKEEALFRWVDTLRDTSGGRFDVSWKARAAGASPTWLWGPAGLRVDGPAPIDLGGVLKGWLADRAADALRAGGMTDFLVDAAGDIVAAGDEEGARAGAGWRVEVAGAQGRVATVRLRDAALSTSGNAWQPGHIHDATTGRSVVGARVVSVVAPSGMIADGLATAIYVSGNLALAEGSGAWAFEVGEEGRRRWSRGARRIFR